jgi:hypothetical protein
MPYAHTTSDLPLADIGLAMVLFMLENPELDIESMYCYAI